MTNGTHSLPLGKEGPIAAAVMVRQTAMVADPMVLLPAKGVGLTDVGLMGVDLMDADQEEVDLRTRGRITPVLAIAARMGMDQTDTAGTGMDPMAMDHSISGLIMLAQDTKDRINMVPALVGAGHKGLVLIMDVGLAALEQGTMVMALVPVVPIDNGALDEDAHNLLVVRADFPEDHPTADRARGGRKVDRQVERDNWMNGSSRSSKSWT